MQKLKGISIAALILGIAALAYGWFQGAFSSEASAIIDIRTYVFMSLGGVLILIAFITDIVAKEIEKLKDITGVE